IACINRLLHHLCSLMSNTCLIYPSPTIDDILRFHPHLLTSFNFSSPIMKLYFLLIQLFYLTFKFFISLTIKIISSRMSNNFLDTNESLYFQSLIYDQLPDSKNLDHD